MSLLPTVATPESNKIAQDCASRGGTMKVVGDGIATYCDLDGYQGLGMNIPKRVLETKTDGGSEAELAHLKAYNNHNSFFGKATQMKLSGIIALIAIAGILYWAYKTYPNATKWVVGIGIGIFVLFCASLYLFFSWGGQNRWEKWFGSK